MVREGLTVEVTLRQSSAGEGASDMSIWGNSPGRRKSKHWTLRQRCACWERELARRPRRLGVSKKIARDTVRSNVGVGRIAGGPKEPSYGPQFLSQL